MRIHFKNSQRKNLQEYITRYRVAILGAGSLNCFFFVFFYSRRRIYSLPVPTGSAQYASFFYAGSVPGYNFDMAPASTLPVRYTGMLKLAKKF
jgi:hypothetical protein